LLEVAVACALLSSAFLVVTTVLRQTRLFSQRVDTRGSTHEEALLTLRRLVDDVAQARTIVAPQPNADGSPRTKPYLVYRNARHETVLVQFDGATRSVTLTPLQWTADGTGFRPLGMTALGASPHFEELFFTVAATARGTNVRLALRTTSDWFFEGVTPWCTEH